MASDAMIKSTAAIARVTLATVLVRDAGSWGGMWKPSGAAIRVCVADS